MKVALCLSGQPRNYNSRSYESIKKKLLDVYDVDVFLHFWWDPNGGDYDCSVWSGRTQFPIPSGNLPEEMEKLYKPKRMRWEKPLTRGIVKREYTRTSHENTPYNLSSMYVSLYKSYQLLEDYVKETSTNYDFVIRCRFDGDIVRMPPLRLLNPTRLYFIDWGDNRQKQGLANNFFITPPAHARSLFSIIERLDQLYDFGAIMNDEQMCYANVITNTELSSRICLIPTDIFEVEIVR